MAKRRSIFEQMKENELMLELEYKAVKELFEENDNVDNYDSFEDAVDEYIIRNFI